MRRQQCVYFPTQLFVARARLVEERGTPANFELERLAQQCVDLLPALKFHRHSSAELHRFKADHYPWREPSPVISLGEGTAIDSSEIENSISSLSPTSGWRYVRLDVTGQ